MQKSKIKITNQKLKLKEAVFLNGKFLTEKEARVSVMEPGFLYGWGLFETMRSYHHHIVYFDAHLERIKQSSGLIGIKFPYSLDRIKTLIKELVRMNNFTDAYVRLTLWKQERGTGVSIIARIYQPYSARVYKKGFSAWVSSFRQNEDSLLSRLKSTNRIIYQLGLKEAAEKGFQEAILLNNRGYITEGTKSNLFFAKDNELYTPALACGCLAGITRRVIFDLAKKFKISIAEGNFTLSDLYAADEAFLTNSLVGVMPLSRVGKIMIGKGKNLLTKFFQQKYQQLLYGN